jgi:hypothetical protein
MISQTCRNLHLFVASTDHLWYQLATNEDLPLELGTRLLSDHSVRELQTLMLRAKRLDRNWLADRSKVHIYNATPLASVAPVSVEQMQLSPGGRWLLTSQRNRRVGRNSTTFSLWSLKVVSDIYLVTSLEVQGECRRFAMDLNEEGAWLNLAVPLSLNINDQE